jgi:glycosyltransferase involved in cell wall biosynthesis
MTTNRDLRVALFTETFLPKLDGVVTITCLLLNHFRQRGVETIVFSAGEHPAEYNGYPIVSIPGVPMPMYPEATLALPGSRSFRRLKEFDPTIVHVINPWLSGLKGIEFARKLDKPLVISFHTHLMDIAQFYHLGFIRPAAWRLHRHFYRKADYRWATSKRIQAELEAHDFGETGIWRRGVDSGIFSDKFRSEDMRNRLTNGQPDKTLLLFVGRVAAEKQIEQIRFVLESVPNTHLAIVGDGPNRPRLEKHFEGCPVTFAGYLKGAELSKAYASSDIFVFPSAIETFGLVVAEAMAAGLPVVASRVGGVPELIESGMNGYIFEPSDVPQMIAYVRELANDPAKRARMGEAARQTVLNLTWDKINDELLDDYHWIIEGHKLHNQS